MNIVCWHPKYRPKRDGSLSLQPAKSGRSTVQKTIFMSNFLILFFAVAVTTLFRLPAAVAQEGMEQQTVSQGDIARLNEVKKAARNQRVEENIEGNETRTDPRDFSLKWMPFYRYTELENGMTQQDLTAFGTVPFSRTLGMFFEVPVAQYRDFSDVPGFPAGSDAKGLGDADLKLLRNPKALGFRTVKKEQ